MRRFHAAKWLSRSHDDRKDLKQVELATPPSALLGMKGLPVDEMPPMGRLNWLLLCAVCLVEGMDMNLA